ncbi:unnamed protein product [Cylicostephanus goldi]|uniref:Vacuolar protein sorting-associated protein 52 homolog n=1 Tax=Cylicostephanus goldi TaxID=71465 RepID=A0A3P7N9K6_CYLGO|nr:unnamed protein product [Cylicostephanus goldi]
MAARKSKTTDKVKSLEDCLSELSVADENVVRSALSAEQDLSNFSAQVKEELTEAHKVAVRECIQNAEKLTDLHNQIVACDQVFERLEKMLLRFQDDLGTISEDMKRLQDQSVSINQVNIISPTLLLGSEATIPVTTFTDLDLSFVMKLLFQELENRQKVRGELSQFVDDIIVPQTMIKVIMEADVSDRSFLEQLHELQHKISFVRAQEFKDARAVYDVMGVLESLKFKAVEKIREWILTKIYMFRKPLSNYQVPQHQLLKYHAASKEDLLGAEDSVKTSGLTGLFSGKPHHRNRATVFSLGSRQQILTHDFLNPLIVPHAAQESNQKVCRFCIHHFTNFLFSSFCY